MFTYKYAAGPMSWDFLSPFIGLVFPLVILDLVLKGFALWRSAQRKEKGWFIALLLVNSLGILPAIYLLTHKASRK